MKKNEEKFYHMLGDKCVGCTDDPVESYKNADTINLTWYEFQAVINPPKTQTELFIEELDELNYQYRVKIQVAADNYIVAVARNGSAEADKVLEIRAEIDTIDSDYQSAKLSLSEKYFGG